MVTTAPARSVRAQSTTRLVWARDLDSVQAHLEREHAIIEVEPGFYAIDETIASADIVDLYRKLVQVGYVNGWL